MDHSINKSVPQLTDQQTLLFTGDSITDCGRARPIGSTHENGLGDGYVALIDATLAATRPQSFIRVLNSGISGNRVTDLEERWQTDVLNHTPDCLSIMIGINDVWRHFDTPNDPAPVTPEIFKSTYRELLKSIPENITTLLATPFLIEADSNDSMLKMMDHYGTIVKDLANEFETHFVDTQAAFNEYLRHRSAQTLAEDRVHPNLIGHQILANAFLSHLDSE